MRLTLYVNLFVLLPRTPAAPSTSTKLPLPSPPPPPQSSSNSAVVLLSVDQLIDHEDEDDDEGGHGGDVAVVPARRCDRRRRGLWAPQLQGSQGDGRGTRQVHDGESRLEVGG